MLLPKGHFGFGFSSLRFTKSTFATDIHVKSLDSCGYLRVCGYFHFTKKGFVHFLGGEAGFQSDAALNLALLGTGTGPENLHQPHPI